MKALAFMLALLGGAPSLTGDVKPFVRGSWQQLRGAHAGQPLVVHFWGVTCAPCMVELPNWGQLQRERPNARIVFVAADPVPVERPQIEAAISKARIGSGENWMFADVFGERLRYEVNPTWAGELPYTAIIGRDGKASFVSGVTDLRTIRAWLDQQASATGKARR